MVEERCLAIHRDQAMVVDIARELKKDQNVR